MERQHVRSCFYYVFAVPNSVASPEVGTYLFALAAADVHFVCCNHKLALMAFVASFSLGALLSARAVAPIMIRQRSGIMALTGSIFADYTAPFNGAYASSKAAVTSLFDALRLELEPYNISVCVVEPGFFTSKLRNSCFDPSRYLEGDSLYSQASLTMSDMVTYQDNLRHVASAEDVAEVIVKKLCRKRGPPPRFSVGTLAWLFKLLGFLCNFLMPRVMHTVLLVYFGLNKKW